MNLTAKEMLKDIQDNQIPAISKKFKLDIDIDEANLADCLKMWEREIETAKKVHNVGPSDYRIAGYLAFWIRKLKPFRLSTYEININKNYEMGLIINELVAIQLGFYILYVDEKRRNKQLSGNLLKRTIKSMRYRSLSPHTMALMYEFFFENNCSENK
jgi:hypothetical protein